jgi:hypothetical protein
MKCKNCNQDILISTFGLRHFCGVECKNEHRRKYLKNKKRSERNKKTYISTSCDDVNNRGGYVSINPPDVNISNPCVSTVCKDENCSPRPLNTHDDFGGLKWYQMAKTYCSNFEGKLKEGFCISLSEPYQTFKAKCSACKYLGQPLAVKHGLVNARR